MLKFDEIQIVKNILPLSVKEIANSLDVGDFRQIIMYY